MNSINVSYWGHSITLLKMLIASDLYNLEYVAVQKEVISSEFESICARKDVPIIAVADKKELVRICNSSHIDNVLVYCFGIIIPSDLYQKKKIINIHPGSLVTNRGAHSILWSVLIPYLGAEIAAYRICCDEIDSGELIVSASELCSDDETPLELLSKLERNLPCFLSRIYEYITNNNAQTQLIRGGIYRERVQPEYYTLNIGVDSKQVIKRKINSQSMFEGAILVEGEKQIRIRDYIDQGDTLILIDDQRGNRVITFNENPSESGGGVKVPGKFNRILFVGSKASGLKVLKKLFYLSSHRLVGCVTVDDRKDVRSELNEFCTFCAENSIDLDVLNGKCDLTNSIEKFNPDICFVMGWYYIISEALLDKMQGRFIGIHNSLLPRHRGFAPVVWAMIAGEKETGFSVFSFDKEMDTGDIWYQKKINIEEMDYISDVLERIDMEIDKFFDVIFEKILSGEIKPEKQSKENVSYGARRTAEDGKIDWKKTSREIYNFIRAQSKPYPGAYGVYQSQLVKIWKADIFPYMIQGAPGQVGMIDYEKNEVVIVCGSNTGLILYELEVSGHIISATSFVKGLDKKWND